MHHRAWQQMDLKVDIWWWLWCWWGRLRMSFSRRPTECTEWWSPRLALPKLWVLLADSLLSELQTEETWTPWGCPPLPAPQMALAVSWLCHSFSLWLQKLPSLFGFTLFIGIRLIVGNCYFLTSKVTNAQKLHFYWNDKTHILSKVPIRVDYGIPRSSCFLSALPTASHPPASALRWGALTVGEALGGVPSWVCGWVCS